MGANANEPAGHLLLGAAPGGAVPGASYKRLTAIGHLAGFDKTAQVRWYRIAEEIPLSDRHAAHILSRLKGAA